MTLMSGTFKDQAKGPKRPKEHKPPEKGGQKNLVREALEEVETPEVSLEDEFDGKA